MIIFDISQEVIGSHIYPGDPSPKITSLSSMERGDLYNLSSFEMCAHNGTHIDAPKHFIKDGKSVGELDLSALIGESYVISCSGEIDAKQARKIISEAKKYGDAWQRILIKGDAVIRTGAAIVFSENYIRLIGTESQSVGPIDAPMEVHTILLEREIVLLEGLKLRHIPDGKYTLFAAPINLGICEGAPCRAVLVSDT